MTNISNLKKINGVILDEWFIPTMFKAIELDNAFVLWSSLESEYYIDSTNNLLKIKYFDRVRMSFPLNIKIINNEINLVMNSNGKYYNEKEIKQFKIPSENDLLVMSGNNYTITKITKIGNNFIINIDNESNFINTFNDKIEYIINTDELLYSHNNVMYLKNYRSKNIADVYIDGENIYSVSASYN